MKDVKLIKLPDKIISLLGYTGHGEELLGYITAENFFIS
jgi:hypothetical protein